MSMKHSAVCLSDDSKNKMHTIAINRVRQRIQIALLHQCDISAPRISWFSDCHLHTVSRWLTRIESGEPITDRPRSGRPSLYTDQTRLKTIAFFCQHPPLSGCCRWTLSDAKSYLNAHPDIVGCDVSRAALGRILTSHALRPHLRQYFLQISDPDFFPKMEPIIGLYLQPPKYLFCFDECTGIQAIQRLAPDFPAIQGHPLSTEFHYSRHGTTDLIAFLRPETGNVFCKCSENHNTETLSAVFSEHVKLQPKHAGLHYICDNLSTHFHNDFCATVAELSGVTYSPLKSGTERRQWLQSERKRIMVYFVPFHGSWLNMIELWFAILAQKCLKNGSFRSVEELTQSIMNFAHTWSEHLAHPFTWTYSGEGLHAKVVRRFMRLLQMESSQLDISFLTKQFLLMRNLTRDYWTEVDTVDWEQLLQLVAQKQSYLYGVIASGSKEKQRQKAELAFDEFTGMLRNSVAENIGQAKLA